MNFRYVRGFGIDVCVIDYAHQTGQTFWLPEHMTISAIQNHLREMEEFIA